MRINDYFRLTRAKLRDARSKYSPSGINERIERNVIKMKTSEIRSKQFQEGLDGFWLLTREMANCDREMSRKVREIRERYIEREGADPNRDRILLDLAQAIDKKAEERAGLSEGFRQFRERYYAFRRKEISEGEFVGYMDGFNLSGVQNAN